MMDESAFFTKDTFLIKNATYGKLKPSDVIENMLKM